MRIAIKNIYDKTQEKIKDFNKLMNKENLEIDETEICLEVKHILEDMQSILDYIAVDIHKKYCPTHNLKKIYFLYARENEKEVDFINKINTNFPKLYNNHFNVYNELASVQNFNDDSKWLIKLNDLTNEVKHNDLYINEIEVKKNTTLKSNNAEMLIAGDLCMKKHGNNYGVYGSGSIYVSGNGHIGFYGNGNIAVGDGVYNVDTGETKGVEKQIVIKKILKSKKYNEDILVILNLIINKIQIVINNLEKYI